MRFLKPDHVRSRTEKGLKRIPLQGVTLEPFALEGLFGFRLLPLPQARAFWESLVSCVISQWQA